MADNSERTPGSGESIRSVEDHAGDGSKTQVILLDVSKEVDDERIGLPQSMLSSATAAGLTTATTLYTAGDQMGSEVTFSGAGRVSMVGGRIESALLLCKTPSVVSAVDLFLFSATVTPNTDNLAWSFSDTDIAKLVGVIEFRAAKNGASNAVLVGLGLPIIYVPGSTSLFGSFITQATHTNHFGSSTDLVAILGLVPD